MITTTCSRRGATALALAALAAAAGASSASATTVSRAPDGALLVTAAAGERNALSLQSPYDGPRIVVYEGGATGSGAVLVDAAGCERQSDWALVCDWSPSAGVRVDLGDGNDRATISGGLPAGAVFSIAGGAGDDDLSAAYDAGGATTLDGGAGDDTLKGGPAADTLQGGDGDDELDGRGGPDHLSGGAGNDTLNGDANLDPSPDVIDGGPGIDTIESDWEDSVLDTGLRPVKLTLGGGADDGRPGEGDDVRGVERVIVHQGATLIGTNASEHLETFQVGAASRLVGRGGNDELRGSDGPDRIDGGPGNDTIDAGFGDDVIVGGPGRDAISADRAGGECGPLWCKLPFGNDRIDARDGQRDSISCGPGTDLVLADRVDIVARDCEKVRRRR